MPFQKGKKRKNLFQKGHKGGPGRPPGLRNKVSIALEQIGDDKAIQVYDKIVELALEGDFQACRYIIDRTSPQMKGRQIPFDRYVEGKTSNELGEMCSKVATMMEEGDVTPTEALEIVGMLEKTVKVLTDTHLMVKIEDTCEEIANGK